MQLSHFCICWQHLFFYQGFFNEILYHSYGRGWKLHWQTFFLGSWHVFKRGEVFSSVTIRTARKMLRELWLGRCYETAWSKCFRIIRLSISISFLSFCKHIRSLFCSLFLTLAFVSCLASCFCLSNLVPPFTCSFC